MASPTTPVDQSRIPRIHTKVNGQESYKIKYLPAEYYQRFFSKAADDLKLSASEYATRLDIDSDLTLTLKQSTIIDHLYGCDIQVRALVPFESIPGMLSFVSGKPNEDAFPFTSISFTATSPKGPSKEVTTTFTSSALKEMLQYAPTDGLPKVNEWVMGLQEYMHKRKQDEGWTVTMGVGSQDVGCKVGVTYVWGSMNLLAIGY